MRLLGAALAATFALGATPALAHVEIEPSRAPAGSEAKLTVVVENERAPAATRRLDIRLPAGVTSVSGRRLHGWKLTTTTGRATLTAPSGRELSGAEEKARFGLLVGLPERPGSTLVFKVLQTYDDEEVVRWIGPPGTSEPAPRVRLTAAEAAPEQQQSETQTQTTTTATTPDNSSKDSGDDDGGVPIWAGVGLILLAAIGGTLAARARNRRRMRGYRDE